MIKIVLFNGGENAFKPDVYGDRVTIVREFSADGYSSYKIKSVTGTIVSQHKEDLIEMMNAMDIHVDNPVCVLTQESSRNFLHSKQGSSEKLYQFFYKGTGLEFLENNYKKCASTRDETCCDLERKSVVIPKMEKELDEIKKFLDFSANITNYKYELVWARVKEGEKMLEEKKDELLEKKKLFEKSEKEMSSCNTKLSEVTRKCDDIRKQANEKDDERKSMRSSLAKLRTQDENNREDIKSAKDKCSFIKKQREGLENYVQALGEKIAEMEARNSESVEEEKRNREQKINYLKQKIREAEKRINEFGEIRSKILAESDGIKAEIDKINEEKNQLKYQRQRVMRDLDTCKNAVKNKQNAFGSNTQMILQDIKKNISKFRKEPIGPIGLYVEVKEDKWIPAVEKCLGKSILRAYICDNNFDDQLLRTIFKKYSGPMPTTIVSEFLPHMHDVNQYKTQSNYPTVLDMLNVRNCNVANCLIDQIKIESRLLIETIQEAQNYLLYNPPINCYSAFLLDCSEICLNPYRFYSGSGKNGISVLGRNLGKEIGALEQSDKQLFQAEEAKKHEIQKLEESLAQIPIRYNQNDKSLFSAKRDLSSYKEEIKEYLQQEEPKDVSCIQKEYDENVIKLNQVQTKEQEYQAKLREELNKHTKIKENITSTQEAYAQVTEMYQDLMSNVEKHERRKEELTAAVKHFDSRRKVAKNLLEACEEEIQSTREGVEKLLKDAANKCPERIESDKSSEELENLLQESEKLVRERSNCSIEELHSKYASIFKQLCDARKQKNNLEDLLQQMKKMADIRGIHFKKIVSFTESSVELTFIAFITSNNYYGKLIFNSEKQTLKIDVSPRNNFENVKNKIGVLSGGEKSFTTVCLLLAMWDRVKSPFKIMDEYDVFMDSNNRKLSLDLMIEQSKMIRGTQFIFLSPLELPRMRDVDFIKVHKMPPPKRGTDMAQSLSPSTDSS